MDMKRYILFIAWAVMTANVEAQLVINPQIPPTGLTVKSQLWSLAVINSGGAMRAQIELSMTDLSSNQQVLTATTRVLDFPKGLRQVRMSDVTPVTYNVLAPGLNTGSGAEGFLPVGNYELCYSLVRIDEAGSERVAEQCESVVIEPLSPPQLVIPTDSERVELTRPLFTWLPPSPYTLFAKLSYDLKLVEVQSLQTGAEAVQDNMPLVQQSNLAVANLQYPVSLPELDTAKLYAWQVTARSSGLEVAKSEVWTFRVRKLFPLLKDRPVLETYAKLRRENDGSYIISNGLLRYQYLNEWNDSTVDCKLYDISSPKRSELPLDSNYIAVSYGENYNKMDLSESALLKDQHFYQLELVNSKQEHWYLKFQYRKPD